LSKGPASSRDDDQAIVVNEPDKRLEHALHATKDIQVKFEIADTFD
jgi:hypothetical protein